MPATKSGMSRLSFPVQSLMPAIRTINIDFTTATNGTIAASPALKAIGCVVAKTVTKVGRYTIQLGTANDRNNYATLVNVLGTVVGPPDVPFTAGGGVICLIRGEAIKTAGTLDVQFVRSDTYADAEVQNGARVLITVMVCGEAYR